MVISCSLRNGRKFLDRPPEEQGRLVDREKGRDSVSEKGGKYDMVTACESRTVSVASTSSATL